MKPDKFKYNAKQLAEFMANVLKRDRHASDKSTKSGTKNNFQYPDDLKEFPIHQEFKNVGFLLW